MIINEKAELKFLKNENPMITRHFKSLTAKPTTANQITYNDVLIVAFNNNLDIAIDLILSIREKSGCFRFILDGSFEGRALVNDTKKETIVTKELFRLFESYDDIFAIFVTQNHLSPIEFEKFHWKERFKCIAFNSIECSFRNQMKFLLDKGARTNYLNDIGLAQLPRKNLGILSLNNIAKPHRLSICSYFFNEGLFDKNNRISFLARGLSQQTIINSKKLTPKLNDEIDKFLSFIETREGKICLEDETRDFNPRNEAALNRKNFRETALSIVTESEFTSGSILRITEKTLKAICGGHELIVLSNPNTIKYLSNIGFTLKSNLIDTRYDSIPEPEGRLQSIIKEIDKYLGTNEESLRVYFQESHDIRIGNIDLLTTNFNDFCEDNINHLESKLKHLLEL